jgi:ABC-2 type transport system permease protein
MATGPIERTLVVASVTFRSAFVGTRGVALGLSAAIYPLVVLGIAAGQFAGLDLLGTAEVLYSTLFLPVVLLLVCLVLGVGAFRGELEDDTLVYPLNRTIPRAALAAGKYLGLVAAAALLLIPSAVVGGAIAAVLGNGPTVASPGLTEALLLLTILAILSYSAIFFLLGLLTRQALVIGLLYGFLWETFISLIAGPIRELSVIYYLRGVGTALAPTGSLGAGVSAIAPDGVVVGAIGLALGSVVLASLWLAYAEIRPAAAPA